jgi:predicted GNAT family acetyltransferase
LTSRQRHLAQGDARALRIDPAYGLFAALSHDEPSALEAITAIVPDDGALGLVELGPVPPPPGILAEHVPLDQMIATAIVSAPPPPFEIVPLREADAADVYALAKLTEPGPFFHHTHRLGDFFGVKVDGRLAAMAGERLRPQGFTEVSGVCTHPDFRGQGLAGGLTRHAALRILARGEVPFLHVLPTNAGAIRLYHSLGFVLRRTLILTVLRREAG